MLNLFSCWLRETTRIGILYLAVGAALSPWAIIYGVLVNKGWDHWSFVVLLLGGALVTANFVWVWLEKRTRPIQVLLFTQPIVNGAHVVWEGFFNKSTQAAKLNSLFVYRTADATLNWLKDDIRTASATTNKFILVST